MVVALRQLATAVVHLGATLVMVHQVVVATVLALVMVHLQLVQAMVVVMYIVKLDIHVQDHLQLSLIQLFANGLKQLTETELVKLTLKNFKWH